MPRTVPCLECRKGRNKCAWADDAAIVCIKCARDNRSCSGPARKTIPPCIACVQSKAKCDWSKSKEECERCHKRNHPCSGPVGKGRSVPAGVITSATSSSTSGSTPTGSPSSSSCKTLSPEGDAPSPLSLTSVRLAQQRAEQLYLDELATHGTGVLKALACGFVLETVHLPKHTFTPEVSQTLTLLCLYAGFKFSPDTVILGAELAPNLPSYFGHVTTGDDPTIIAQCGVRRSDGLQDLSNKIWTGLYNIYNSASYYGGSPIVEMSADSPDSDASSGSGRGNQIMSVRPVPADVIVFSALMRVAVKLCALPREFDGKERIRGMLGWAANASAEALAFDKVEDRETGFLREIGCQIAFREASHAVNNGRPSLLTPDVFNLLCEVPQKPVLPILHPGALNIVFLPVPICVPGDLHRFTWSELMPPPMRANFGLLYEMSMSPGSMVHSKYADHRRRLDELFTYFDQIYASILLDERLDDRTEERAWQVLRCLFTLEQNCIEKLHFQYQAADRIVKALRDHAEKRHEHDKAVVVLRDCRVRLTSALRKTATRLRFIMGLASTLDEVYPLLEVLIVNIEQAGSLFYECLHDLHYEDIGWIARALRFAGFWDPKSLHTVEAVEAILNNLGPKQQVDAGYWVPAYGSTAQLDQISNVMIHNALRDIVGPAPTGQLSPRRSRSRSPSPATRLCT
ncbi:hypothetical protein T439DRAFT_329500 [Meredithblackwellia eburnea MCA 4105]